MPGYVLLCKRFRDNGKLLEFCGKLVSLLLLLYILEGLGGVA